MKKYQIIYADPPWEYKRKGKFCAGRYYSTMTVKQICDLPINQISDERCLLFLWTTNSFLRQAFEVVDAWGFEYKTCLTWAKSHFGLGYWLWGQTEHCFLAVKGKYQRFKPPLGTTLINAPKSKHSKKPMAVRSLIERFPHENKIELFARERTLGWDVWGNEVESDIELKVEANTEPLSTDEVVLKLPTD